MDFDSTTTVLHAKDTICTAVAQLATVNKPPGSPALTHTAWQTFAAKRTPHLAPSQRRTQTIMLAADVLWRGNGQLHAPLPVLRLEGGVVVSAEGMERSWTRQVLARFRQDCLTQYPWVVHLCDGLAAAVVLWTHAAMVPLDRQAEAFGPLAYAELVRLLERYELQTMLFDVEGHREALIDVATCLDLICDLARFRKDVCL